MVAAKKCKHRHYLKVRWGETYVFHVLYEQLEIDHSLRVNPSTLSRVVRK